MTTSLPQLLQRPDIWRSRDRNTARAVGAPTGHAALDRHLHGGGWPRAAVSELLLARPGCGELRLLLPLLAALSREQRWLFWIDPPFIPYAPALLAGGVALERLVVVRPADRQQWLWACTQALRTPGLGAALCWPGSHSLRYAELRQLQVAAGAAQCCGFLLRDVRVAVQSSPCALRLRLRTQITGAGSELAIDILKQRGGHAGQRVILPDALCLQPQLPLAEWPYVSSPAPARDRDEENGENPPKTRPRQKQQPAPKLRDVTWQ